MRSINYEITMDCPIEFRLVANYAKREEYTTKRVSPGGKITAQDVLFLVQVLQACQVLVGELVTHPIFALADVFDENYDVRPLSPA